MARILLTLLNFLLLSFVTHSTYAASDNETEVMDWGLPVLSLYVDTLPTTDYISAPEECVGITTTNNEYVGCAATMYRSDTLFYSSEGKTAKIRIRGNTGASIRPPQYKLKLSTKQSLIEGTSEDKEWLLLRVKPKSPGLLLNLVGREISKHFRGGEWQPEFEFVNLMINDEYWGLYQLAESVKRSDGRVDIKKTGFLIEMDAYFWSEDLYFKTDEMPSYFGFTYKYPDSEKVTDSILGLHKRYLNEAETAIYTGEEVAKYIDLESFAAWHLSHQVLGTSDMAGSNIYLFKKKLTEENTHTSQIKMGPLWDFDTSFHNDEAVSVNPWLEKLLELPEFQEIETNLYSRKKDSITIVVNTLIDSLEKMVAVLDSNVVKYSEKYGRNTFALSDDVDLVRNWFDKRLDYMLELYPNSRDLLRLVVSDTSFVYDGNTHFPSVVLEGLSEGKKSVEMTIVGDSASDVGVYSLSVTFSGDDLYYYRLPDTTTFSFSIYPQKVDFPSSPDMNFVYNGKTHQFEIIEDTLDRYMIDSLNVSAIQTGSYVRTVKLRDNNNYVWEDSTIRDIQMLFVIDKATVAIPSPDTTHFVYKIYTQKYTLAEDTAYTISDNIRAAAGEYEVTVALNDTVNYEWTDATVADKKYSFVIDKAPVAIPSPDNSVFIYNRKDQIYEIEENPLYSVDGNVQKEVDDYDVVVSLNDSSNYKWEDGVSEPKHYQFDIVESSGFEFDVTKVDEHLLAGGVQSVSLDVSGLVQYYQVSSEQLPELNDTLKVFDEELSAIMIPTSDSVAPGVYKVDIKLYSGHIEKMFSIDLKINYPASYMIVCWTDVIAVQNDVVKFHKYQWYKDGELIPGANSQYYTEKGGVNGCYMCEVDEGLFVGPAYYNFSNPFFLTAHGEKGRVVASVIGKFQADVMLMDIKGTYIESKKASENMEFIVKPGIYILTLEGTDQSVKVVVD